MSRRLIIRPEAETDIVEAVVWYEGRERGLGLEVTGEIHAAMTRASQNPLAYLLLRSQQSAVGSRQAADGSQQSAVGSRQAAGGSRQAAVSRWQSADGSRQMAIGRWQSADGRRRRISER